MKNNENNFMNKDIMLTGYSCQSTNMTKGNNVSLSFPCLTLEFRNKDIDFNWMLGSSPSMTKGNNTPSMTKGNNDTCVSIVCHSRAQTRESRSEMNPCSLDTRVKHEYDNMISSCHCALDAESRSHEYRIESGRSMVEMLGVLAVIGVLSIGGIMGYSYGMDKYRANETINDVNLRAMDLISQLTQGGTPTLASWEEISTAGYPISLHTDESTTNHYIKVEKVPFRVCDIIADTMPESVVIEVNNDTEQCTDGENVMYFAYAGFENTDIDKNTGEKCGDTICSACQKCDVETRTCVSVFDYEEKCTSDGKTGWCVSGVCEPDTTCNCGEGEYCTDTNDSSEHPTPSGNCVEVKPQFKEEVIEGTTYYISDGAMSWWDAVSACKALGNKQLLHVSDLVEEPLNGYGQYTLTQHAQLLYPKIGNIEILTKDREDSSAYTVPPNGWVSYGLDITTPYYRAVCR